MCTNKNFLNPSFYLIIGKYISCFCVTWAALSYQLFYWVNKALRFVGAWLLNDLCSFSKLYIKLILLPIGFSQLSFSNFKFCCWTHLWTSALICWHRRPQNKEIQSCSDLTILLISFQHSRKELAQLGLHACPCLSWGLIYGELTPSQTTINKVC